jgi:hypothetical protein
MQAFGDGTFHPDDWIPEDEGKQVFKQLGVVE